VTEITIRTAHPVHGLSFIPFKMGERQVLGYDVNEQFSLRHESILKQKCRKGKMLSVLSVVVYSFPISFPPVISN